MLKKWQNLTIFEAMNFMYPHAKAGSIISFLTFFFAALFAGAQPTFEKNWGGNSYQEGIVLCRSTDNGFVIAGRESEALTNYTDIAITKTDSLGDSLWTKTYGGNGANDFPASIVTTADGGYLIAATTYSLSLNAPTQADWWVLRLDANGDTLWTKIFYHNGNDRMQCIWENNDGSIICGGWQYDSGWGKGECKKLDSSGNAEWSNQIPSSGNSFVQYCRQNYDGAYLFAGSYLNGDFRGIIYEFDPVGSLMDFHIYDKASSVESINSVEHLTQGGYLVSAKTGYSSSGYDIWVLRLDDSWDTLWTKTFNDPIYLYDPEKNFAFSVIPDSGFVFGGDLQIGSSMQAMLYRGDNNGNLVWTKNYGQLNSESNNSVITLSNGFAFCGSKDLLSTTGYDFYLVRTDRNGSINGINLAENQLNSGRIRLSPNPACEYIKISGINKSDIIRIYNANGALVMETRARNEIELISTENLVSGIYLVTCISDGRVGKHKLVISK